jgi:hypothetical protein
MPPTADLKLKILQVLVALNVAEERLLDLAKKVFAWLSEEPQAA